MIPWGQIISTSVTLADVAHSLYKKTKKKNGEGSAQPDGSSTDLSERIDKIEKLQLEQAKLLEDLAEQNKVLIRKTKNAYMIAIGSLLIALTATLLHFY